MLRPMPPFTHSFNVETLSIGGSTLTMWDVGGCSAIRPLWRHYFANSDGVVIFVDAANHERLGEASEEIRLLVKEPVLQGLPFVVLANKQV